jgi:hypothetical protein
MKRLSSIWVSCSNRIDWMSCGVITSDWLWRNCRLADSAMTETNSRNATLGAACRTTKVMWPKNCFFPDPGQVKADFCDIVLKA